MATENHSMVPEKIRTITKKLIFLLVFEEPDFSIESATISDEFATLTDDTMTRNDDNNWIVVIGFQDFSWKFDPWNSIGIENIFLVPAKYSLSSFSVSIRISFF